MSLVILFLIINSFFLFEVVRLPLWRDYPGSGFLPAVVVAMLYLLLATKLVHELKNVRVNVFVPIRTFSFNPYVRVVGSKYGRAAIFFLISLLYVLVRQVVGYYVSSFLYCLGVALLFGFGTGKPINVLVRSFLASIVALVASYLLFVQVFDIPIW